MKKQKKHDAIPDDMYKEHILELYKSPSNFGELKGKNKEATEYNTTCGDEVTMQLLVKNGLVKDVKFHGTGCVISLVSASMLTDKIKNMDASKVMKLNQDDILRMLKVNITPGRMKCALLPLEATKKALK